MSGATSLPMATSPSPYSANGDASPGARVRAILSAFVQPDLPPDRRADAIATAISSVLADTGITEAADVAGIYGALHALAPALDALHTDDDLRAAIASRADRYRGVGDALLALHGGPVKPWPIVRVDMDPVGAGVRGGVPRLMLRALKPYGVIRIDALTTICNVPATIWEHAIGEDALMELEFSVWRAQANALGPDVSVDKDALVRRIAWLCRVSVATQLALDATPV